MNAAENHGNEGERRGERDRGGGGGGGSSKKKCKKKRKKVNASICSGTAPSPHPPPPAVPLLNVKFQKLTIPDTNRQLSSSLSLAL